MRRMLASLLLLGTSVVLALAQGAAGRLEGTWSLVGDAGEKMPDGFFEKLQAKLVVKNGLYEQTVQGKKLEAGRLKFDMSKNPATVDFEIVEGQDKGSTQLGIFKIEGDQLFMAINKAGSQVRPRTFQATKDIQVPIFKRSR